MQSSTQKTSALSYAFPYFSCELKYNDFEPIAFLISSFVMSASTAKFTFGLNMNFRRTRDTQNIIFKEKKKKK